MPPGAIPENMISALALKDTFCVCSWSDGEIFTGFLAYLGNTIRSIAIEQPLPCCSLLRLDLLGPGVTFLSNTKGGFRNSPMWKGLDIALKHVTHYTIAGQEENQCLQYTNHLLFRMPSLEKLEIRLSTEGAMFGKGSNRGDTPENLHGSGLQYTGLSCMLIGDSPNSWMQLTPPFFAPNLRDLRIIGCSSYPDMMGTEVLTTLLHRHKGSLQSVKISNLVFLDPDGSDIWGAARGMRNIVFCLVNTLNSASFVEVEVPRHTIHWLRTQYGSLQEFFDREMSVAGVPLDRDDWWRLTIRRPTEEVNGDA
jgi:hypothetical protein